MKNFFTKKNLMILITLLLAVPLYAMFIACMFGYEPSNEQTAVCLLDLSILIFISLALFEQL